VIKLKNKIGKGSPNPKNLWSSGQFSFGSLVYPPVQGYILIDRFLMEGYPGGISLRIIERVRFLPPLHLYIKQKQVTVVVDLFGRFDTH